MNALKWCSASARSENPFSFALCCCGLIFFLPVQLSLALKALFCTVRSAEGLFDVQPEQDRVGVLQRCVTGCPGD